MSRRIYVAAPLTLLAEARTMAARLTAAGHVVVSTWHAGEPTIAEEAGLSLDAQTQIATQCLGEIERADALVLLYGGPTDRHGSFLETGYALGRWLPVVAVRTSDFALPTILLRHPYVIHTDGDLESLGSQGVARALKEACR